MFLFALATVAGIVSGADQHLLGIVILAACICCIVIESFGTKKKMICYMLSVGVIFVIFLTHYRFEEAYRNGYLHNMAEEQSVVVWGKVYKTEYKNFSYRYYLTDCSVSRENSDTAACNNVIAYTDDDHGKIGDYLMVEGRCGLFATATNEGEFDLQKFYRSQKIDFCVYAYTISVHQGRFAPFYDVINGIRDRLSDNILTIADEKTAGVIMSMLLGDKTYLDEDIKEMYQMTGISHILAISGLHISIVGMAFYRLLRKKRVGFGMSMILGCIVILSYAVMTGNAISTKRAVGMFIITMLAAVAGRVPDLLNSLGIMVIYILWQNPFAIAYPGFILSAGAILAIGIVCPFMAPRMEEMDTDEACSSKRMAILTGLWSSAAIQLAMLPIVAYNYYEIPAYAVFLNMLVIPLLPVIFISAFLGSVVSGLCIWAGKALIFPAGLLLKCYELLCGLTLRFPGAQIITGQPSDARIIIFYLIFAVALIVFHKYSQNMIKLNIARITAVTMLVAVLLFCPVKPAELDVLDVGQGDGIYYGFDRGPDIFIDGGSTDKDNVGENIILPFLKSKGIRHISYWFVSHADEDHISGLIEVIDSGYPIDNIVVAAAATGDEALDGLIASAKSGGINVCYMSAMDEIRLSETAVLTCLYPSKMDTSDDRNDLSLVLKITDGEFSGIFAGDISSQVERELVDRYGKYLDVMVYKADHHGSKYSNCKEWLETMNPQISIVSCASENSYGHPSEEAVCNIENTGSCIFYTMTGGQIKYKESAIYENNRQ